MEFFKSIIIPFIVTMGINWLNNMQSGSFQYITGERKEWREKIRVIIEKIDQCEYGGVGEKEIYQYLTRLEVNINPIGKHNPYNYAQDGHIWESIKKLREVEEEEEFNKQKRLLISYLSLLLKENWERSKSEIRGIDKGKIVHGMAVIFLIGYVYFLVSILKIKDSKIFLIIFIYGVEYWLSFCISNIFLQFIDGYESLSFKKIVMNKYIGVLKYFACCIIITIYFLSQNFIIDLIKNRIWMNDFIHIIYGIFLLFSMSIHVNRIEKKIDDKNTIEREKDKHTNLYKEYISNSLHIIEKIILCINDHNFKKHIEKYKGVLLRNLEQLSNVVNRRIYEREYNIYEIEKIDSFIQQQEVVKQIKACRKEIKKIKSKCNGNQVANSIKVKLSNLQEIEF